jgi:hypothetical protein
MSRNALAAFLTAAALAVVGLPAAAQAAPAADAIWIVGPSGAKTTQLHYGDHFNAGYSSRTSQPWGYAECRPNASTVLGTAPYTYGDVMWGMYRSLYAGGPVPAGFDLTDPVANIWLGGGATCQLKLVKFSTGYTKETTLATTSFEVLP